MHHNNHNWMLAWVGYRYHEHKYHRGYVGFESLHAWTCAKSSHLKHSEEDTISSYYITTILMHVHDRFRSLAGHFSTYLLAFTCTKQENCLCIKILKPKLFQMSPPYLPICGITLPFQVNLHVPPLKTSNKHPFLCAWIAQGVTGGSQYLPC